MPKIVFRSKNEPSRLFPIKHYATIKNKYCIAYFGQLKEYLIQLSALRPIIEEQFKGIQIYLACSDGMYDVLENYDNIVKQSDLGNAKERFAYLREIKCDLKTHPILELLEESEVVIPNDYFCVGDVENKCVIITRGADPPTKPLSEDQIQLCISFAKNKGVPWVLDGSISNAGFVVGAESWQLYLAGINRKITALVPTGIGTNLYKKMFPHGEILT